MNQPVEISTAMDAAINKPCVGCAHHKAIKPKKGATFHVCSLFVDSVKIDPVTGKRFERHKNCYRVRLEGGACGLNASLFEPSPNTPVSAIRPRA